MKAKLKASMVDVFAPQVGLLCKLGSIIVHFDEGAGAGGHDFDWTAARSLMADREVQEWINGMDAKGLCRNAGAPDDRVMKRCVTSSTKRRCYSTTRSMTRSQPKHR